MGSNKEETKELVTDIMYMADQLDDDKLVALSMTLIIKVMRKFKISFKTYANLFADTINDILKEEEKKDGSEL